MWPTGQDLFVLILIKIKIQYNHPPQSMACLSMTKWDFSAQKWNNYNLKFYLMNAKFKKNTRLCSKTWLALVKNEKVMFKRVLFLFSSAITGSGSRWNCQSFSRQGHWPDPHITVRWFKHLAWCYWSPTSRCFPPIKNSYLIQWVLFFFTVQLNCPSFSPTWSEL